MPVNITVKKNGSYRVEATDGTEIKVVDADGKAFDLRGKTAFSLCRCGHSANKPFCDGSHSRIGFQADDVAPRVEGVQQP
ncbi:MAG: CDGSH iron-sulfur domain-containing protein [Firmicutes bacterium]|nr:CDGSH iron-sulfur domain-containing protein [Bacillota bacterium]